MSSYVKNNLMSLPTAGPSSDTGASSSRDDPFDMSMYLNNLMEVISPPTNYATLAYSGDYLQQHSSATTSSASSSSSPPQNPIGPPPRDYFANLPPRDDTSSPASTVSLLCYKCEDRNSTTRCVQCNEVFCDQCGLTFIHKCLARQHTVVPIRQISPIGRQPNTTNDIMCEIHPEPIAFYCHSCMQLMCSECIPWAHKEHKYTSLNSTSDECRREIVRAFKSAKLGNKAVKSAIDAAFNIAKTIDKDYTEITAKIKKSSRIILQAIELREKEMLTKLADIRNRKLNEICEKQSALRGILSGLAHNSAALVQGFGAEDSDLFSTKQKAIQEIDQFAKKFKKLLPTEDRIIYLEPHFDICDSIKRYGDTMLASHAPTEPLRGLQISQGPLPVIRMNQPMPECLGHTVTNIPPNTCLSWEGHGRAILGYNQPITLQCARKTIHYGVPLLSFAPEGQEAGEVSRPWGLCVSKEGDIIVADRRNNRIQVFYSNGDFKFTFGSKGPGPGQFDLPAGITTDSSGRIIIIDKDNHRVQIFSALGDYLFLFGNFGKDNGQFQYPWDVAVNTMGNIAVTDTRNHRIQLFTSRGQFITKFCFEAGNPSRQLKGPTTPRGICFTTTGHLIVSDFENHRMIMLDVALTRIITTIGKEGCGLMDFNRPSGIVTDDYGRIIIADSKNHRISVYSSHLQYIFTVDVKSPGLDDKDRPCDVALTPDGNLVVLFETLPDTARDIISHGKEYIKVY